jgi:nucleotide-binding universal stress UspA family protein
MQLEKIIIATDFSEPAAAAAEWVARYFAPAAKLVLVYVVDTNHRRAPSEDPSGRGVAMDDEYDLAARRLRDAAAAIGAPRCTSEIRPGRTSDEIVRASEELHADLVAVGKHSRRRGIIARLGSTAEEIVRSSRIPVLLVAEPPDAEPRTLLAAVDNSRVAPRVVQWARFLAERFGASATAMHVVGASVFTSAIASIDAGCEAAEVTPEEASSEPLRTADDWLSRLAGHDANRRPLHVDVMFGDPAEEIIAAAARMDADMIVMGSRGLGRLGSAILGSVASAVLRSAPCPVLVIREPEDEVVHPDS